MQTTTFVTQYEGPRKVHVLTVHSVIGILSSLGTNTPQEQCELVLKNLQKAIDDAKSSFDVFVFKQIVSSYAPELDAAFVYITNGEAYCATQGTGIVFVRRNGQVKQVVADGSFAKGLAKDGDEFITTTSEYLDFVGGMDGFTYYFGRYRASEVSEMMETYEDQSSPSGFVAVHIGEIDEEEGQVAFEVSAAPLENTKINDEEIIIQDKIHIEDEPDGELVQEVLEQEIHTKPKNKIDFSELIKKLTARENLHNVKTNLKKIGALVLSLRSLGIKKLAGLAILLVVLVVVIKSIPYGEIFKNRDQEFAKFENKINAYLNEAETMYFGGDSEVSIVLQKARDEIEVLSDSDKKYFASKLKEAERLIDEKETKLLKVSQSKLVEYYSLSLIGKKVTVTDADTDGEMFYILDSVEGAYYAIPTGQRSQEIVKSDKIKNALQIAAYEGRVYILTKNDGIYRIEDSKSTQVVKPENSWGEIVDMKLYASNIYLLDSGKGDIYKYPGIDENEFGTQVPYLVEESRGTLKDAIEMVISGPVYVVGKTQVAKYVTGRREDFILKIPYKDGEISLFAASPDNKLFYVFDSIYKAVYVYGEDMIMARQFKDEAVKNTTSLLATEDNAYVITNSSVLTLPKE